MEDYLIIREKLRKYEKGVLLLVFQGAETKTLLLYTIFTLIHLKVVESLLEELHEGIYASHMGGKSLLHRALTQGY